MNYQKLWLCVFLCFIQSMTNVQADNQASVGQVAKNQTNNQQADEQTIKQAQVQDFNQAFSALLMSEKFSENRSFERWQKKEQTQEPKRIQSSRHNDFIAFLRYLTGMASVFLKAVLIGLLLLFIFWVYRKRALLLAWVDKHWQTKPAQVSPIFTHLKYDDRLPDDDVLVQQILACITAGDYVQALSYLYRGSLRAMRLVHTLPINKSQTELQCQALLHEAKTHQAGELVFFDTLVALWQQVAYANQLPDDIADTLMTLLATWQRIYQHANIMHTDGDEYGTTV